MYLNLEQPSLQGVFAPHGALRAGQSVLHVLHPGPHALQRLLQRLVLLQGYLAAAELLLGHPE